MNLKNVELPTRCALRAQAVVLRHEGKELDATGRVELLKKLRSGTFTGQLELEATTYIQRPTPNRNYVRFKDSILSKVAKSFVGAPFLRDHAWDEFDARGGTILESKLAEDEGHPAFRQVIQLVKPWAIEAALDGTMDRFSIAWLSKSRPLCSVDGDPILSGFWGKGECFHFPGEEVELEGGKKVQVEAIYQDAAGVETSAVSVPAVEGTHIDEIRQSLAAQGLTRETIMKEKFQQIAKALGLAETATAEEITAAAEKLQTLLDAEKEAHARTREALEAARGEIEAARKAKLQVQVDELIARCYREGRLVRERNEKGDVIEGAVEKAIRLLAESSLEAAEEYVSKLPKILPVGDELQTERKPARETAKKAHLDEDQRRINRKLGINDETFLKHNPPGADAEPYDEDEE